MTSEERLISQIEEINRDYKLNDEQLHQLRGFFDNLVEWNKVMNLTAITEEEDVYTKHFLDSMTFLMAEDYHNLDGKKLIDVGTGAGFPGLVLAIAFPALHVTLMDSLNKRINFLNDTVEKLGLNNVTTIHARAEELARDKQHREHYDYVVSRAVANIATLSEYCLPFTRVGGKFIAFKSEKIDEELENGKGAIPKLGGKIARQFNFILPQTDYRRTLLIIDKKEATGKAYPRKAGTPAKEPLK